MSTELFFQGFILLIHLGHISLLSHFVFCGCGFCSAGCSVVVLLACLLSVLWWMTLPKRCVQVSLWEGLVPAHWWVEVGLVLLVGRVVLRLTLSRLSAGWGCVSTL